MVLPANIVRDHVELELDALQGYCERHRWTLQWDPERQLLTFDRPSDLVGCAILRLTAEVEAYPLHPPAWRFWKVDGQGQAVSVFPSNRGSVGNDGSIFHPSRVICAPFNRLAYGTHQGPHPEWGMSQWKDVRGVARATTLTEMLAIITAHLKASPGVN
ncbi:MAG: hypothetical protein KF684_08655 [Phycisphaeraceae bacterium]|nr:hypothetical protein [Phycisphaeraceae bacterium]